MRTATKNKKAAIKNALLLLTGATKEHCDLLVRIQYALTATDRMKKENEL
jgi:hypothetical protein